MKNITYILACEVLLVAAKFYLRVVMLYLLYHKVWSGNYSSGCTHRALSKEWVAGAIVTATFLFGTSAMFIAFFFFGTTTLHFLARMVQGEQRGL